MCVALANHQTPIHLVHAINKTNVFIQFKFIIYIMTPSLVRSKYSVSEETRIIHTHQQYSMYACNIFVNDGLTQSGAILKVNQCFYMYICVFVCVCLCVFQLSLVTELCSYHDSAASIRLRIESQEITIRLRAYYA